MNKSTSRRLGRAFAIALLASLAAGCSFLADEFSWLDRTPPGASVAPDAPQPAAIERP
jgi:hypothetical protein